MHPVLSSDIQYAYRKNISALFQWIKWKQVVLFKLHKGMTEKKIVTKKKKILPAYVNVPSNRTLSYLEVHDFISLQFETIMLTNTTQ